MAAAILRGIYMDEVIEAEIASEESSASLDARLKQQFERAKQLPVSVLAVIGIMLVGTMGGAVLYGDDIVDWIQGTPDYELIEFDPASARGYAESLIDLGHPEWEGRMSGTNEEHNTAEFIKSNFTTMGIPSTIEDFDVPMFVIDDEPELGICHAGDVGETLPAFACGATDILSLIHI